MMAPLSALRSWHERRIILRDLRRSSADANEVLHFQIKGQLTDALAALDRNDRKYADAIWIRLTERHPDVARSSPLALKVLIGLRRYDEAEALMRTGQKKHPGDPHFAQGLAEIAHAKRDFDTAIERWAFVRKRFPGVVEGYTYGAGAFVEKGQLQRAVELALQAIKKFPDHIGGYIEHARIAVKQQDWEQAQQRWKRVLETTPFAGAYVGAAQALSHLGRYDEAEELLQQARYRFGTNPGPLSEYARVAEVKGDIPEAVQRWNAVLYRFPLDLFVHSSAAEAFEKLGDPAEAEATLRAAIDRFPTEPRPLLELAKLFHYSRRDFDAAAEAWAALRKAFPDNEEAYANGADALRQIGRLEAADALREEQNRRFRSP